MHSRSSRMSFIFYNKANFARPSVGVGGVAGEMMPPLQPELEDLLADKYVSVAACFVGEFFQSSVERFTQPETVCFSEGWLQLQVRAF